MAKITDKWNNILGDDEYQKIESMVASFKKNKLQELEVSFRGLNYANYMRVIEHYVNDTNEENITSQTSLDISILLPGGNTYRVSLLGTEKIQIFLQKYTRARSADIIKYASELKKSDDVQIMLKDRGSAEKVFIEDFNILFKNTTETPVDGSTELKFSGTEKILFRYKDRASFAINDNVRVDITKVQESNSLMDLSKKNPVYELEMEVINRKISTNTLFEQTDSVLRIVQNTNEPIGKKEAQSVLNAYQNLFNLKHSTHLDSRNVISIETQHIIKFIPNKYATTDKADGERYFFFAMTENCYLISTNMVVKKLDVSISNKKYQNMVLDGELIKTANGEIFMAFDVIYADGVDYRYNDKYPLIERLNVLKDIIEKAFGTLIPFVDYASENTDMELSKIRDYYTKELKKYWKTFNKKFKDAGKLYINRKIYLVPYGIDSSEVFMYADLIWKSYVYGELTPYKLDGIIYTPLASPYMIKVNAENLDNVPLEYKWKPPTQNSIDFFVKIQRDSNGNEAIFYDNTVVRGAGNAYKICNLFVGLNKGSEEKPIPFKIAGNEQQANIYLTDDEARDAEGRIIEDQTVVEFIYDATKADVDDAYKWIPLKTRYDKTESVQKYGRKYGNNLNIAVRIWRTITNPITEENIASLANPSTYQKEIERFSKVIEAKQRPTTYYQKKTSSGIGMRAFNNWIKSNMILTYCRGKENVLDIGCGRGGDLIKYIHAGIKEYVGLDIDNNGLYVINDSAHNRYKNLKSTNKNVPPMYFINADARGLFTVDAQEKIIPSMTNANKKLIETYLSGNKKYSVISCQFTIHYYLSDELSWSNFCKNIDQHLDENGYLLITCFDGDLIYSSLKDKQKMNVSYTDNKGNKNTFFEILKIYTDKEKEKNSIGMAIDLYNSLISNPGVYMREYLVFPDHLKQSLKEKAGLELVETDSFYNLFNLYKNYFTQEDMNEVNDTSSKKYEDIKKFYSLLDMTKVNYATEESDAALASFKFTMLNRYYVFKKASHINLSEPSRIVGMNHEINLGKVIMPYFDTYKMVIEPEQRNSQINKIYHWIRKTTGAKPSVYLIRHTIPEDKIDNETFRRNKLEFSLMKEGTDPKVLLIYKSPEKYFYPISYNENDKQIYLLEPDKIVNDLDILVELTNQINNKH